jgi:hypothetical protein
MDDAFHQHALGADSLRLAGICWRGTVFCYTRSFFGFAPAPSQAQTMVVALCRITTRRLRSRGLPCGDPPGWNHCWASSTPDAPTLDPRGELVADQHDNGGPGAYNRPAWNGVSPLTTLLCYYPRRFWWRNGSGTARLKFAPLWTSDTVLWAAAARTTTPSFGRFSVGSLSKIRTFWSQNGKFCLKSSTGKGRFRTGKIGPKSRELRIKYFFDLKLAQLRGSWYITCIRGKRGKRGFAIIC